MAGFDFLEDTAKKAEAAEKAGKQPTRFQAWIYCVVWTTKILPEIDPDAPREKADFEKSIKIHRGGYAGIVMNRANKLFFAQTLGFILAGFWVAGGRKLIGMGLMKLDIVSGRRSCRFYVGLALMGYGIGLPLVTNDAHMLIRTDFGFRFHLHGAIFLNFFGSIPVAIGHVGVLMLIYKAGPLTCLTSRLAAVGRLALTTYLAQSIVCTTLFYGYGFGAVGHVNRTGLAGIVLVIWIVQLLGGPIRLERCRFGSVEWL